jgi:hypothetical protein
MIRSPEPFFAFFFAAIVSPVSSVFPSITVDAQKRSTRSLGEQFEIHPHVAPYGMV